MVCVVVRVVLVCCRCVVSVVDVVRLFVGYCCPSTFVFVHGVRCCCSSSLMFVVIRFRRLFRLGVNIVVVVCCLVLRLLFDVVCCRLSCCVLCVICCVVLCSLLWFVGCCSRCR